MILTSQFVWGSIPTWAIFVLTLIVAWRVSRGGGGSAVSELSKANEVLTRRVHELGAEVRALRIENTALKAKTDFAAQMSPILKWTIDHETRAQERHVATLNVLDLIAERLGPDNGGNGHDTRQAA